MKKIFTIHMALRFTPIVLFVLLMLTGGVDTDARLKVLKLCCYLLAAAVIYVSNPLTREDAKTSAYMCASVSVYYLTANFFVADADDCVILFLLPSAFISAIILSEWVYRKYREPASLFRKDAPWCSAEEDSRTIFNLGIMLFVPLLVFMNEKSQSPVPFIIAAVAIFITDVFLHYRTLTGHTVIIRQKKERRIQSIIISNGNSLGSVPEVETNILNKIYNRVEQLMRDKKPYLNDKFTLVEMADILKVNKVYISRAVNKYTNKNFRQYVNWHRVAYAVKMMREDPYLKVIELAFMSGFHSQVTFNMSFRMFMDEAPSDMLTRLRLSKPRPAISKIEVRMPREEALLSSRDE